MICQNCKATIDDNDKFCPKCGGGLTRLTSVAHDVGSPFTPPTREVQATSGARVVQDRVPIAEGGDKYRGLKVAARGLIRSAAVIRVICYVLAVLSAISVGLWFRHAGLLAFLFGLVAGIGVGVAGLVLWLFMTIFGELMYVIIDVEENLRRRM